MSALDAENKSIICSLVMVLDTMEMCVCDGVFILMDLVRTDGHVPVDLVSVLVHVSDDLVFDGHVSDDLVRVVERVSDELVGAS